MSPRTTTPKYIIGRTNFQVQLAIIEEQPSNVLLVASVDASTEDASCQNHHMRSKHPWAGRVDKGVLNGSTLIVSDCLKVEKRNEFLGEILVLFAV